MQTESSQCAYAGWPECFGNPLERASHADHSKRLLLKPPLLPPTMQDHSHVKRILQIRPPLAPQSQAYLATPPACAFSIHCKRTLATRKCYHCAKFDVQRTGYYCDECFVARHPPLRLTHSWTFLKDERDSKADWIKHLTQLKLEQDFHELRGMLDQTSSFLDTAAKAGASHHPTETKVKKAIEDISTIDSGIRTLMGRVKKSLKCKHLTRADAVRKIQDMWKVRKARKHFKALLRSIYKRMEDPVTGKVYYFNTLTEMAQWDKPLGLGSDDYAANKTKKKAIMTRVWTQSDAAEFIQRAYRRRQATATVRQLIHKLYRKVKDPASGMYYYYNKQTGEVSWTKPKLLGQHGDIAVESTAKHHARATVKADPPNEIDAAQRIQRMFRCGMARRQMHGMISHVYVKIWDDTRAQFYFYNTSTKTVSWAKPKWVDEDDLMSPRTHQAFLLQEKVDAIRNGPPDAAVQYLQRLIRRRQARRRLQVMLAEVYEMVLDEATGEYFYHNKKTGNVTWTKPPLI
ncbi:hypothetical protein, variant [Aphanomyces astaci]|uniref:WW domain-containing protein n=1 Tax=Aphanomyces astaci TaxID=112090 RepID=W4H0I4_APHAT|nr:hypothetical protein, variant [Aphanomyces astaci]ETV84673.1 hypothetical protein, variant [Aphanomyces astaci]|eukprot:XP_009826365.1 hypothetical protein, variant [Aphanomyces astaci]